MKGIIIFSAVILTFGTALAELATELKDGFEEIVPVVKATNKYYMQHVRDGWDFGMGPIAFSPLGWLPNVGRNGRYMGIDCSEDVAMKPFVHSGIGSFRIGVVGSNGCVHVMRNGFKPGRYQMSVWTRGTGTLVFWSYNYLSSSDPGCVSKLSGCTIGPVEKWTKTEAILDMGGSVTNAVSSKFAVAVSGGDVYIDDLEIRPLSSTNSTT